MEVLETLGINGGLLLAQGVNFFLLLFILYRFLYKPVLKMLNERTEKIEKSLKEAEEIEKRMAEVEFDREKILEKARLEAEEIIKEAKADNDDLKKQALAEAEKKSEAIISKAKKEIEKEKDLMMKNIKNEIAGLVDASLQIIVEDKKDKIDQKLVKEAIASVSKEG